MDWVQMIFIFLRSLFRSQAERRAELHRKRKTAMSCGNRPGTNRKRKPKRAPRDMYLSPLPIQTGSRI